MAEGVATRVPPRKSGYKCAMHAAWWMLGALAVLAIAYRYYSAFIAAKVLCLDDARVTPAHTRSRTGRTSIRRIASCSSAITSPRSPAPGRSSARCSRRSSASYPGFTLDPLRRRASPAPSTTSSSSSPARAASGRFARRDRARGARADARHRDRRRDPLHRRHRARGPRQRRRRRARRERVGRLHGRRARSRSRS